MSDVLERFLRYVQVDTQSADEHCDRVPSTEIQFDLAHMVAEELRGMGTRDVTVTDHAYVTAWIPASSGSEERPRLGLIAHLDTTEQAPGFGVKPHVLTYQGGDLVCGVVDGAPVSIAPSVLPALNDLVGQDLVCTDGTTLLGADDKAGCRRDHGTLRRVVRAPRDASSRHRRLPVPRRGDWTRRRAARHRRVWVHLCVYR